jgi:hypothetical protein
MGREKRSSIALIGWAHLCRITLMGLTIVVGRIGILGESAHAEANRPRVGVESAMFDWGSVAQGSKVTHDFTIKNSGDIDLVLQRIVPSCGCTAASLSSDRIPPGGQGMVRVELDTAGFSGSQQKMVRLFTNDPAEPYSTLTMKGVVEPDVLVEPNRLVFPDIVRTDFKGPVFAEFTLKVRPGSPVTLSDVATYSKVVLIDKQDGGLKQRTVRVAIDPRAPNGELRERVVVNLAGGVVTSMSVPVIASIRGAVQVKPATVSFGLIEGTALISKKVQIENSAATPLAIRSLESDSDAVQARFNVVKEGRIFDIEVTVDPAKVSKNLRASVTIKTDSPSEGTLILSVYGILPPKLR